ncbi:helix-turn-helix domain-containing protein, partial [Bacillus subtilis]
MDIAADTGFKHISHFNKVFKEIVGIPPLQYRKKSRDI